MVLLLTSTFIKGSELTGDMREAETAYPKYHLMI